MSTNREWAPDEKSSQERAEFRSRAQDLSAGRISNDEFRQFRLERGVYGQRQPGVQMLRIKIPYGGLTPSQLRRIAEISTEYGHGIAHLTTRQDIQLHYINLSDLPRIMELLAEVDVTTREACGNTVRNVTACPFAGVCRDEVFDVTPHAHRVAQHLMRNPSTAGLGRKFKISFSGCDSSCGLVAIHDIGLVAAHGGQNGSTARGFKVYVGGGLGAAPKAAQLLYEFIPEDRLIPLCEAITRVFFLYGERDRRMKSRMKFLIEDIGIDAFRGLVEKELDGLPATELIAPLPERENQTPAQVEAPEVAMDIGERWLRTNVYAQRQPGWVSVTVRLPLGDIEAGRLVRFADVVASFTSDIRVTVEQNFLLRWIHETRLGELYRQLRGLGLVDADAGRFADITVCPGADTCNLGITSSKGLGGEFGRVIEDSLRRFSDHNVRIKISGCPNSCGQHHIADVGFYGCSLKVNGRVAPAFQMLLGGEVLGADVSFAKPVLKVVSNRLPDVLAALLSHYEASRQENETFAEYVRRVGIAAIGGHLAEAANKFDPANPAVFRDWGGHSLFTLNVKEGECAGVSVDFTDALLGRAEAQLAESEDHASRGDFGASSYTAYAAVIQAAKAFLASHSIHATSYHQILNESEKILANVNGTSGEFAGFRKRVEEFKQSTPDKSAAESYRVFARASIDRLKEILKSQAAA